MRRASAFLGLALLAVGGCTGGPSETGAPTTSRRSATTTASAPTTTLAAPSTTVGLTEIEREVEAAYLRSWDVYARAMRSLDTSKLGSGYAGVALEEKVNQVEETAARGVAAVMQVDHRIVIEMLGPDSALVVDQYTNHSVEVDPVSGKPLEEDPNTQVETWYTMERDGGAWKISTAKRIERG